jgi:hypothetical protein
MAIDDTKEVTPVEKKRKIELPSGVHFIYGGEDVATLIRYATAPFLVELQNSPDEMVTVELSSAWSEVIEGVATAVEAGEKKDMARHLQRARKLCATAPRADGAHQLLFLLSLCCSGNIVAA